MPIICALRVIETNDGQVNGSGQDVDSQVQIQDA